MAATVKLSVWPERTDARVGLQGEQGSRPDVYVDLRSKLVRDREVFYSSLYDPLVESAERE